MPDSPSQKRARRAERREQDARLVPLLKLRWKWLGSPGSLLISATPELIALWTGGARPIGPGPSRSTLGGMGGGPNAAPDPEETFS